MKRAWLVVGVVLATAATTPASAYAATDIPASTFYPHIGVSLIGLLVATILLAQVIGFRRLAWGGAIAEKINYVILAILCLAASALTEWAVNFAGGITIAQAQLAREVLVIIAMALLAAYYYSVRAAMNAYLRAMTDDAPVTPAPATESEHDGA